MFKDSPEGQTNSYTPLEQKILNKLHELHAKLKSLKGGPNTRSKGILKGKINVLKEMMK